MAHSRPHLYTAMKIYLCAITQNEKGNMDELTRDVYKHLDGLIIVDGGSTDGTRELMEERKGNGAVIYRKWTNDHDFQMNEFLRQGPMKNGDWYILRDSTERLNPDFVKNARSLCEQFDGHGAHTVYDKSKILLVRYYDDQFFLGNPHWGLRGQRPKAISIRDVKGFEDPKSFGWSVRNETRSKKYHFEHLLKYYYVYGRSNHMVLESQNDREKYLSDENDRQRFREICFEQYNAEPTINSLTLLLKSDKWKENEEMIDIINKQRILSNFYRATILNEDANNINRTQSPEIP